MLFAVIFAHSVGFDFVSNNSFKSFRKCQQKFATKFCYKNASDMSSDAAHYL